MPRQRTIEVLENLRSFNVSDTDILEYLLYNYFSAAEAQQAIESAQEEFITNDNFQV